MGAALRLVERIKDTWPDAEIERVREILIGDTDRHPDNEVVWARQYDLKRNGRWVPEHTVQTRRNDGD